MDFWRSDYEDGNCTSSLLVGLQELVDSPNVSRDSVEYSSDDPNSVSDSTESLKVKQTTKTTLLAKKRLQAYSTVSKFKPGNIKEGKDEFSIEKPQKSPFKKSKKTIYPGDAAKAVIRDIENLKRAGFGGPPIKQSVLSTSVPADIIPVEPVVPISLSKLNIDKSPAMSCSDMDEENLFKKREIRCRNIRRSTTISKRSPSPKNSKNSKTESYTKKEKREYPSNWTEYKELNLNPQKHAALKSKLFKKPRSKHFVFKRYFNFELPSAPIEIYKCQPISGDALWMPFSYIRSTATKPQILYSTNKSVASPGYLTRKQLFSIIPCERKAIIEKLWKVPSRLQPSNKKITSRKWYPRNWKKFDNSEAKLLEKSVGLSFLQSYSDEEEEEEEVIEDNNEDHKEEDEFDIKTLDVIGTSPSATPKEQPKSFEYDIEDFKYLKNEGTGNWDEPNTSQFKDVPTTNEKTPPVEDKEDGEVSVEGSPKVSYEDEYQRTKKEVESLEEALKESSINYVNNIDKISVEVDKKVKAKKKNSRQEKESKSKNKKNKSKRKFKNRSKSKEENEDDIESSDLDIESTKKKKQKKEKKHLKDKAEKKVKKHKAKKKTSKRKKEEVSSNSESVVELDTEEYLVKKNKKKKRKSNNKLQKESTYEELSSKAQVRKNSADITHEGYEDDVKFFTARFDKDDIKEKVKHKREDFDFSRSVQDKIKTEIDIEDLTTPLKSDNDKATKRVSKYENNDSDALVSSENNQEKNELREKCSEKQEESIKRSNDRNKVQDEFVKDFEVKEARKKDDIKIDLLKKNEEYLREQRRMTSHSISSNLVKLPEPVIRTEDESSLNTERLEKHKSKDTQLKERDITSKVKEHSKDKVIEKPNIPKKPKDLEDSDLYPDKDKKLDKFIEITASNKFKQNEDTDFQKDKTYKNEVEESQNKECLKTMHKNMEFSKNEMTNRSNVIGDEELTDTCISERREDKDREPDWEQIKNKRKRHISDTAQEKVDKCKRSSRDKDVRNIEKICVEKELPIIHIKKEKEDKQYEAKVNQEQSIDNQINTSWETDEEVFEGEKHCSSNEENSLNFEIPLNIEHFTRREIKVESDKDEEIRQLQRHSRALSAERKKLEIEKLKVKELERELLQAHEKEIQQKAQTKHLKTKRKEKEEREVRTEFSVQTPPKKRRWDIKSLDSTMSTPKIKSENSIEIIDLDTNTSHSAVTLENEYEEFLKAVESAKKVQLLNIDKPIVIDSSSDSSMTLNDDQKSKQKFDISSGLLEKQTPLKRSSFSRGISNLDDLVPKYKGTIPVIDIPTLLIPLPPTKPEIPLPPKKPEIPLPPQKPEEIRPVPVPLPKLEAVFDLNKPLINLSLSANVTQNITLSLATSATSISAPTTSSIDIPKTSVEISTPISKDTIVNMNNIPLPVSKTFSTVASSSSSTNLPDLNLVTMPSQSKSGKSSALKTELFKGEINFPKTSPLRDTVFDSTYLLDRGMEKSQTKQKIVFATLTLPSKKQLLNNSSLNLDDSDNDDQSTIEELKRKKLEALIEDNKKEVLIEEVNKQVSVEENIADAPKASSPIVNKQFKNEDSSRKIGPHKYSSSRRESSPRRKRESPLKRRDPSPKRRSPRRRSPRRSPRRRSPTRKRSPHRRRSPVRRSISPRKRRSISPRKRRSPSPRRKRSISPKGRQSPRRNRSISPKNKNRSISPRSKTSSRHSTSSQRNWSPKINERKKSPMLPQISSPFGGLKRSVADSTISDDQLPQSTTNDTYSDCVFPNFQDKNREPEYDSPKRIPLDVRISQVLGYDLPCDEPQKPTSSTTFNYEDQPQLYQYSEQYKIQSQVTTGPVGNVSNNQGKRMPQSCYKQVGNMLQIVPNDDLIDIPVPEPPYQAQQHLSQPTHRPIVEQHTSSNMDIKPQILQVGNMLQIVPNEMISTNMIPVPPTQTEVKIEKIEEILTDKTFASSPPDKPSAEAAMLQKIAERRAEREKRRQERERKRKEKERRHKEKEKMRQAKMKIKTENMIKKALEMEQEDNSEPDILGESPIQWPPVPLVVTHSVVKEVGKSILSTSSNRKIGVLPEEKRTKIVQFADGVKPGEGTSPSAGEELSSPPPPKKKLPKEKRYKKMKFGKKSAKKKVKVKIIKKPPSPLAESDSEDNLPPPSPPPGSPPPHIFPPRIKVNPVNNVPASYLATIIQTAQQQQQQQQQQLQQQQQTQQYQSNIYCPPVNLLMAPPPPPQGHSSAIPAHHQSPRGTTVPPAVSPHGPQSHFHPSLAPPPPPPPPVSPHNRYPPSSSGQSGHHRHY